MKLVTTPLLLVAFVQLLSAFSDATPPPPPPLPLPWQVDAYVGFERDPSFDSPEDPAQWYWQNILQINGTNVRLYKQTVVCEAGKLYSSEGDGGTSEHHGVLTGSLRQGTVALTYVGCDRCLHPPERTNVVLPIQQAGPDAVRMGAVEYSKAVKPYPDTCPDT